MTSPNGNIFRVTDPVWGEPTCHPSQKACKVENVSFEDIMYNKNSAGELKSVI